MSRCPTAAFEALLTALARMTALNVEIADADDGEATELLQQFDRVAEEATQAHCELVMADDVIDDIRAFLAATYAGSTRGGVA